MKTFSKLFVYAIGACLLGISPLSSAEDSRPTSGLERSGHFRTHLRLLTVPQKSGESKPVMRPSGTGLPPYTGYFYETPASLGCVYGLTKAVDNCNPQQVTTPPSGGSRAIAIVDACNYPTALGDLDTFSNQFGLVTPNLTVVYADGTPNCSSSDTAGWQLEASLDLQWAHAMAPNAELYLVLAKNDSTTELLKAVDLASSYVAKAGGGQVSMSWGGSEFSGESSYDTHFQTAKVVYLASAGDSPGTSWPSTSPYVVAVGGTSINRNSSTGAFLKESVWSDTGGGPSLYYSRPSYQNVVAKVGNHRGVPDVASAADPNSGAWVYNSSAYGEKGWWIVGGTSWSSPTFAGIINAAGHFAASWTAELTTIYGNLGTDDFREITNGFCGPKGGYLAAVGWDFCSGVGSNLGYSGK